MKKAAPAEGGGCMVEGGQEAILQILDVSLMPLKSRKVNLMVRPGFIVNVG